jgi:hypothetical protein
MREQASYMKLAEARKAEAGPDVVKGWKQIAAFLGQPVSVAQRWANEGMPVKKQGRYVESSRKELNGWLGRESAGEPIQIATPETDLSAELTRGLSFVRNQSRNAKKKAACANWDSGLALEFSVVPKGSATVGSRRPNGADYG